MSQLLKYRTELDGLRAKAGFLGVDIFFVISGYIITRLLLHEMQLGVFQFRDFYVRRVRRILPVLFFVMVVSFPFAWMLLLPRDFVEYSQSILSSIFFSSNFFFYSETTEYGAGSSLLKPFLHTWSLSVEEQFYIIFPCLLLLAHKFPQAFVKIVILIGIALSLLAAEHFSTIYPNFSFYLLPTRVWELLIGAFIALSRIEENVNRRMFSFFPILGLGLLIASLVIYESNVSHPGVYTILPVLGISLLIAFTQQDEPVGKLLSLPILGYIGILSYSLYLWHFPIFAFARAMNGNLSLDMKLLCLLLTLVLSVVSYHLIEKPFRNKHVTPSKVFIPCLVLLLLASAIPNSLVIKNLGFQSRLPEFFRDEQSSRPTWSLLVDDQGEPCHNKNVDFCHIKKGSKRTIVILGDSHMSTLQYDLFNRLQSEFDFLSMTYDACWFARGFALASSNGKLSSSGCSLSLQERRFKELKRLDKAIVIIGGRLPLYLSNQYFDNQEGGIEPGIWNKQLIHESGQKSLEQGVGESVHDILSLGHHVILVYPLVEAGWHVPQKIFTNMQKFSFDDAGTFSLETASISNEVYNQRASDSIKILDGIEHPNIERVYPSKATCNAFVSNRCVTHNGSLLFYTDDDHPSQYGARLINGFMVESIKKITN